MSRVPSVAQRCVIKRSAQCEPFTDSGQVTNTGVFGGGVAAKRLTPQRTRTTRQDTSGLKMERGFIAFLPTRNWRSAEPEFHFRARELRRTTVSGLEVRWSKSLIHQSFPGSSQYTKNDLIVNDRWAANWLSDNQKRAGHSTDSLSPAYHFIYSFRTWPRASPIFSAAADRSSFRR